MAGRGRAESHVGEAPFRGQLTLIYVHAPMVLKRPSLIKPGRKDWKPSVRGTWRESATIRLLKNARDDFMSAHQAATSAAKSIGPIETFLGNIPKSQPCRLSEVKRNADIIQK